MVVGGGAFGGRLVYEVGALVNGISACKEEIPESFLAPSSM